MAVWTETLQKFDAKRLRTLPMPPVDGVRDARRAMDRERKHITRSTRREFINGLRVDNAVATLGRLPDAGESFHIVMTGNFDAFGIVSSTLELARPSRIASLALATLGFNEKNSTTLLAMLDSRQVERVLFICSHYFKCVSDGAPVFETLHHALTTRGHRCVAIRSHAKIILMELNDGRHLVWESSANLRSCRNIEQAVLTHDRDLLLFHRAWMEEVSR